MPRTTLIYIVYTDHADPTPYRSKMRAAEEFARIAHVSGGREPYGSKRRPDYHPDPAVVAEALNKDGDEVIGFVPGEWDAAWTAAEREVRAKVIVRKLQ